MRSSEGNLWLGGGVYCGVPATLIAFGIAGPMGLLVLAATIAAIVIGVRVEKTRAISDEIDRHTAECRAAEEKSRQRNDAWGDDEPATNRDQ